MLKRGKRRILILLNDSDRERAVRVRLASRVGKMRDYYDNGSARLTGGDVVEARVPPFDFLALVME